MIDSDHLSLSQISEYLLHIRGLMNLGFSDLCTFSVLYKLNKFCFSDTARTSSMNTIEIHLFRKVTLLRSSTAKIELMNNLKQLFIITKK